MIETTGDRIHIICKKCGSDITAPKELIMPNICNKIEVKKEVICPICGNKI